MANFQRHIEIAAITTGIASTALLGAKFITPVEAAALWISGTFGGILPDIDSDNSTTIKVIFTVITVIAIGVTLSQISFASSTVEIWLVILFGYGVINLIIRPAFEAFTVHRGIFHSLVGGAFFGLIAIVLTAELMDVSNLMAWLFGLFVFLGFVIHLFLDEIYSVDFMNVRVKRSFGTALKLFDYKNWRTSALMILAVATLFYFTPNANSFAHTIASKQAYRQIKDNLIPLTRN